MIKLALFLCLSTLAFAQGSIVDAVRAAMAQKDFAGAENMARAFQARNGDRSDTAAALSWLGRGYLAAGNLDKADAFANQAKQMGAKLLKGKLDSDPWLPTAIGAAIEVHAQVLSNRGERPEAVAYLREQLTKYTGTSLPERIRKNINLLNMEGKPAPELASPEWIGVRPPTLASLRGKPVLLFFWAHWCSDCRAEVAILAKLQRDFAPKGLVLIGPTRLYGYVAGGEDALPAKEKVYIEQVRHQFYAELSTVPVPLSAANFITYGSSSTPTLVLIDRAGVVKWYHPGSASEAEITTHLREVTR